MGKRTTETFLLGLDSPTELSSKHAEARETKGGQT